MMTECEPAWPAHVTGGLVYAVPMRRACYMTMLDPLYERFGAAPVFLVYLATLWGDLLWTASILTALGDACNILMCF